METPYVHIYICMYMCTYVRTYAYVAACGRALKCLNPFTFCHFSVALTVTDAHVQMYQQNS